jgi:hypothetical protein
LRRIPTYLTLDLPDHGPSPVRLMIEASGITLEVLRDQVLDELHATT